MHNIDAARKVVEQQFPECDAAILAGSTTRGEATEKSDLDIIIVTKGVKTAYEETIFAHGWYIDILFNSPATCVKFFEMDKKRRRPAITHMCAQGIILKDNDGVATLLQEKAQRVLDEGPELLEQEHLDGFRRELTGLLDDFITARNYGEGLLMAQNVALQSIDIILGYHQHWLGEGKWLLREFRDYDPELERQCISALETFYKYGLKDPLIQFGEYALDHVGGRRKEGITGTKPEPVHPQPSPVEQQS